MKRRTPVLLALSVALAVVLGFASPASATTTLTNTGFETGDLTGWGTTGGGTVANSNPSPSGGYYGVQPGQDDGCPDCAPPGSNSMYQGFDANAGDVVSGYALFDFKDDPAYPDWAQVAINGNVVFSATATDTGWTFWTYTIPADGSYVLNATSANGNDNFTASDLYIDGPIVGLGCTITGTSGNDALDGTSGDDVICGGGGDDFLRGLGGQDTIYGEGGKDVIQPGAGDDTADGGDGNDQLNYSASQSAVDANLGSGTATGEGSDTVAGFENLAGSRWADTLTGDTSPNRLSARGGNDQVYNGDGGSDRLIGGRGIDLLDAVDGADDDLVNGGNGPAGATDTCSSDAGDTVLKCEA